STLDRVRDYIPQLRLDDFDLGIKFQNFLQFIVPYCAHRDAVEAVENENIAFAVDVIGKLNRQLLTDVKIVRSRIVDRRWRGGIGCEKRNARLCESSAAKAPTR